MSFRILAILLVFTLVSCGAKKRVLPGGELPKMSKSKLVKENTITSFKNTEYNTVKINSKMSYTIGDSSQRLGLKMRIAKGEKIWLSADFLGLPVAKILIDKENVYYYNKFDKTFFKGSYDLINQLLGVDVSYDILEKTLVGDTFLDLDKSGYNLTSVDNTYFLKKTNSKKITTKVGLYPLTYKVKSQSIINKKAKKAFSTFYNSHQLIEEFLFPKNLEIKASNKDKKTIISMVYSSVAFNKELKFPFKIPKECDKEIKLNQEKK